MYMYEYIYFIHTRDLSQAGVLALFPIWKGQRGGSKHGFFLS